MSIAGSQSTGSGRPPGRVSAAVRRLIMTLRRHWRLVALGAVLVLFVVGPGYTATRPAFFERFEVLGEYHDTWYRSTHARVNCQDCHVAPGSVSRATYNARMVGEIYLSLLPLDREPNTLGVPLNTACESCHIDLRNVSPAGDLNIPHRAHVDALEIDCVVCHNDFMTHNPEPESGTTPRMAVCMECHDGEQAKSDCDACHSEKGMPDDHRDPAFILAHAELQDEIDCVGCHAWREEWCSDCHDGRPVSHGSGSNPSEWRAEHGTVVAERRNCEACHEAAFCIRCHGEVPALNLDPTLTLVR